jgi:CheY-like chemotaxis protein
MKNMHVLLVEDNEGDILLLTELLSERPTIRKISVAKTGQEAIDFVQKTGDFRNVESPDLILLDINLPLKNGHELLLEIKGNEKTRRIPVMMLTTSSAPEDINGCYDKHANLYMTKPGDMNSFEDALNAVESFWNDLVHLPRQ